VAASESPLSIAADISTIATFFVLVAGGVLYGLNSVRPFKFSARYQIGPHDEGYQVTVVTTIIRNRTRDDRTIANYYLISDPGFLKRLRLWQIDADAKPFTNTSLPKDGKTLLAHDRIILRGELHAAAGLPYKRTLAVVSVGNRPYAAKIRQRLQTEERATHGRRLRAVTRPFRRIASKIRCK